MNEKTTDGTFGVQIAAIRSMLIWSVNEIANVKTRNGITECK